MGDRKSITVTMPEDMYYRFTDDAKANYDNCYWLKIAADEKIFKGVYDAFVKGTDMEQQIKSIKLELIDIVHKRYDEEVKHLKKKLANYERRY